MKILQGNSRLVLRACADRSVQCCVTSPPYWQLRDYGTRSEIWPSNQPLCNRHKWNEQGFCVWCNAWLGQLGLEPSPALYVQHLVEIFREVKRVLKPDGTLWLNLGDTYSKVNIKNDPTLKPKLPSEIHFPGLKKKDLVGIPWAVAFALRDDGWYLRSDIIWYKTNAMPESIKCRPSRAHEYIFLLTKSAEYYYDQDAIREPHKESSIKRGVRHCPNNRMHGIVRRTNHTMSCHPLGRSKRTVWMIATASFKGKHYAAYPEQIPQTCIKAGSRPGDVVMDPFAGAGTTGVVARKLGRKSLLIETSKRYIERIIKPRLREVRFGSDMKPLQNQTSTHHVRRVIRT